MMHTLPSNLSRFFISLTRFTAPFQAEASGGRLACRTAWNPEEEGFLVVRQSDTWVFT